MGRNDRIFRANVIYTVGEVRSCGNERGEMRDEK